MVWELYENEEVLDFCASAKLLSHLQARWQDLIEERNSEVLRIRAICSNMEEQNTTLLKRCNKLEDKNEELREAYNSIGIVVGGGGGTTL